MLAVFSRLRSLYISKYNRIWLVSKALIAFRRSNFILCLNAEVFFAGLITAEIISNRKSYQ